MLLASWRNRGPLSRFPPAIQSANAIASLCATRGHEVQRAGSLSAVRSRKISRPQQVTIFVAAAAVSATRGADSSARPLSSSLTKSRSDSSRVVAVAARRGGGDDDEPTRPRGTGLLSRWSQLTSREKAVVATFVALAVLFGPRLLLLSLVSLEAAATGALLAAERALGAAFLTSFAWLAGVAALLLAGLFVYFLVLEEERLEDSSDAEE